MTSPTYEALSEVLDRHLAGPTWTWEERDELICDLLRFMKVDGDQLSSVKWDVLEHNGYRYEFRGQVYGYSVSDARAHAARMLGGEIIEWTRTYPDGVRSGRDRRRFKVRRAGL